MTHGSLFSGIGGFDLAATWAGWGNKFHCEINRFGRKILKYYWPNSISYEDITKTDFTKHAGTIDIISGGFPCQPFSVAGKRLGTEDERHLWPEMLRAIREVKPRWVVGENVPGLINWDEGVVFEQVFTDLEAEGYEVQAFVLPACGVNAPHRRERVWIAAYSNSIGGKRWVSQRSSEQCFQNVETGVITNTNTNTNSPGFEKFNISKFTNRQGVSTRIHSIEYRGDYWQNFPTQHPVCCRNDGFSSRLDGITLPKWRYESIKAYGNAIVPQVAYQIFKAINEFEKLK